MKKLLLVCLLCCSLGCTRTIDSDRISTLNFLELEDSSNSLLSSVIFKSTDYSALEETPNSLLGNSKIRFVNDDIVIIASSSQLYLFSTNGKFLNKIGINGKGPGEYLFPGSVDFFGQNEDTLIRVVDPNSKRVIWYNLDGSFISEQEFITQADEPFEYSYLGDSCVLVSFRREKENGSFFDELQVLNQKGDFLFSYADEPEIGASRIGFMNYPVVQYMNGEYFVSLPFNDTIFHIDTEKKQFRPFVVEFVGSLRMPREIAEDFELNRSNRHDYITQLWSVISSRFIFSNYSYKQNIFFAVFDLEKNAFIGFNKIDTSDPGGIGMDDFGIKDSSGIEVFGVFPEYAYENKVYDLVYPEFENNSSNNPILFIGELLE